MPLHWRVMLSKKLWAQLKFSEDAQDADSPLRKGFAQSRGRAAMKTLPSAGDKVSFVWDGTIVMRGTITSDGFLDGDLHQTQHTEYMKAAKAAHQGPTKYALLDITEVLEEPAPIRHTGQATWIQMPVDCI